MRCGIKHYLLKPCNETEIIEVIQEVKKTCYQKRLRAQQQEQSFQILLKLHESVVQNLIIKSLSNNPDFEGMARHYERFLSFSNVSYEVCKITNVGQAERGEYLEALQQYHEAHAPGIPLHCVYVADVLFAAFEAYDYDYSALDALLQKKTKTGRKNAKYQRYSFANLNALLPVLSKTLHTYEEIFLVQNKRLVQISNQGAGHQKAEQFLEKMKKATPQTYPALVQQLAEQLMGLSEIDTMKSMAVHIFLNLPSRYLNGKISQSSLASAAQINECATLREIRDMLIGKLEKLNPDDMQSPYTGNDVVDKTIAYVYQNIADPELSLKGIAEKHLYMNVDYVSKKFVKVVGCKFSAFLAKTRVEKAKQLLATPGQYTVTSVAIAVGCSNNPQYFSCLFKKQTGITPTEYIRKREAQNAVEVG